MQDQEVGYVKSTFMLCETLELSVQESFLQVTISTDLYQTSMKRGVLLYQELEEDIGCILKDHSWSQPLIDYSHVDCCQENSLTL